MSSIVNGYMNDIERENDMFNRSIEIESNKISLMVEAYYNKLENDYLLAEQKVMMENGTYDDLTYLYMEANEESKQNKETIFQKIKAFFQKIFDSIKNLFRRGDAYEGDAPKCFIDAANGSGSSEIVNFFKKIGNDFKNGNVVSASETLVKGGLTAFSVCVAIDKGLESASNIIHYPKKAYLKVKDWFDRLTSELQKIESELIAAAQNSNNEKATSFANEVKAKLGKIILWIKDKWQTFVSFFHKNNDNEEENPDTKEEERKKKEEEGRAAEEARRKKEEEEHKRKQEEQRRRAEGEAHRKAEEERLKRQEGDKARARREEELKNKQKKSSTNEESSSETSTNNGTQDDSTDGDLYDEYTEIDDYDYDEINRIFTEYTGDPLVDELLDIFDEF